MSDLIRREDVVEALYQAIRTELKGTFADSMSLAIAMANNIPSAESEKRTTKARDIIEEKTVKVKDIIGKWGHCECGTQVFHPDDWEWKYCPHCGVRLEWE